MNRTRSTLLIGTAVMTAVASQAASAQSTTFQACRVPGVGAIYMIGAPGLPEECLDASHVAFSWTENAPPPDASVTENKLANGAVTTVKIAPLAVTSDVIADGAITEAKLDADLTVGVQPGTIGTLELADDAVTSAKIAPGAVGPAALGLQIESSTTAGRTSSAISATATCGAGQTPIGGGHRWTGAASSVPTDAVVVENRPSDESWVVTVHDPAPYEVQSLTAYALCVGSQ